MRFNVYEAYELLHGLIQDSWTAMLRLHPFCRGGKAMKFYVFSIILHLPFAHTHLVFVCPHLLKRKLVYD